MGWPQIAVAMLLCMNVGAGYVLDGRPRNPWNFSDIVQNTVITAFLLYAGGFWK